MCKNPMHSSVRHMLMREKYNWNQQLKKVDNQLIQAIENKHSGMYFVRQVNSMLVNYTSNTSNTTQKHKKKTKVVIIYWVKKKLLDRNTTPTENSRG